MKFFQSLLILFFSIVFSVSAQINKFGTPLSNYFSPDGYKANPRNYSILVNKVNGKLFVGNAEAGVMVYDGVNWEKKLLHNRSIVYSLAQDDNGIVYVGGTDEFGFIDYNKDGDVRYNCISDSIVKALKLKNSSVWKTYVYKNKAYYCLIPAIIEYEITNSKFKVYKLPKSSFLSFVLDNGELYVGNYDLGLLKLKGDTVVVAKNGTVFKNSDIYSVINYDTDELLIAYRKYFEEEGKVKSKYEISIYNYKTGDIRDFILKTIDNRDLTNKFENTFIYDLKPVDEKYFLVATLGSGAFLIDKNGVVWEEYSTRTGFVNDYAISLYVDRDVDDFSFWSTFDNGFYKINSFLPIRKVGESYGIKDVVKKSFVFEDKLYVAFLSSFGYFDMSGEVPQFKRVKINELSNAVIWTIEPFETKDEKGLLVGSTAGLGSVINGKYNLISNSYVTHVILRDSKDSSVFYISHENGLLKLKRENHKWIIDTSFKFLDKNFIYALKQIRNYLWVSTMNNGVYRIDLTNNKYIHFEPRKKGLPNSQNYLIEYFDGEVLMGTDVGLYKFDVNSENFIPYNLLNFDLTNKLINFLVNINGHLWLDIDNKLHLIYKEGSSYKEISSVFNALPEMPIEDIFEKDGAAYIAGTKGFYSVVLDTGKFLPGLLNYSPKLGFYPLVRASFINSDSTFFKGVFYKPIITPKDTVNIPVFEQANDIKFVFPFKKRNLVFNVACPIYTGRVEYSYFLEGFSDSWSKWSYSRNIVFTNLKEGDYVLKVRARDIFGNVSKTTELRFSILSPWYRTWWAYLIYIIIVVLIVYGILKYYTRKLERDKKRLEEIVRQRTAEIAQKNEQLQELVDEVTEQKKIIEEKNKDITDSIKYAEQIQVAVLPEQWEELKGQIELFIYFKPKDIVSGDFYFVKYLRPKDIFVAAAVDCTGHGVPGAFMSLLGVTFLNDILGKNRILHSNEILDELRKRVIAALNQDSDDEEKKKDGMDIALVEYFIKEHRLEFSGANNPLYLLRNRNVTPPANFSKEFDEEVNEYKLYEFKADRQPIGYSYELKPFTRFDIDIKSGDTVYMFSDGFADQFGGPKGKKYTYKRFKRLFVSIAGLPMEEQRQRIADEAKSWIGQSKEEQIDDQLVIGIRFL
jgi:serine phosphatase RsbU (regulator of sigma subunit)